MQYLDKFDKKLLFELDKNAAITLASLSKKLKHSKQTITYRISRLEKLGVIQGYKTIIDMTCLGYTTYRMYIKLQNLTNQGKEMFDFLKSKKQAWSVALMQGKWDIALFFGTKSITELHSFIDELMFNYGSKIKNYSFSLYQPVYFFARHFFLNTKVKEHEFFYGLGERKKFDELDLKILEELKNNARVKNIDIARKLKVSLDTILRRRKGLEKEKIIVGYKLLIDYNKLGYTAYRIDFYLNDYTKKNSLFTYCKDHKNIYGINNAIAGADFEIALAVKDHYEFNKILQELMLKFGDIINSYDYIGFSTFSFIEYIPD